jgi:hypothetical protein
VTLDQDTFLVTVYVVVDDLYKQRSKQEKPVRPGPRPVVSDSEVLTLALLCQWHPCRSERAFLRFVGRHWRSYFPVLLSQSAFNRRVRDLWGVLARLGVEAAWRAGELLGIAPAYEVVDAAGVPLVRRCRGRRSALFGDGAGFGRGGADRDWYYGVKLLCVVDQHGLVSGFAACRADTEERWLAEAVFRWRPHACAPQPQAADLDRVLGPAHRNGGRRSGPLAPVWPRAGAGRPAGCPLIADLGYAGRAWARHWRESYGAVVITPEGRTARAVRQLNALRQLAERVLGMLLGSLGLAFPRARSLWGVMARVCAKIAAFNTTVLINHLFNRPPHALFNPFA